jgi:esterase/lipase superfamily enzyme
VSGDAPSGESTYGVELVLSASCTDREDGALASIVWSNQDGTTLASGPALRLMPEPGRYSIFATCRDAGGRSTTVAATPRFDIVDRWSARDSIPVSLVLPFATNRGGALQLQAPASSFDSTARDSLVRGVLAVNVPARDFRVAGVAQRTPFMRSVRGNYAADDATRLSFRSLEVTDSAGFSGRLATGLAQDDRSEVLVFVHGYRTSFEGAVTRAARLAAELQYPGAVVAFAWPSDAMLSGYRSDQRDARDAGRLLVGFLAELQRASAGRRLSVIAHSMGAEVLASALRTLDAERADVGPATRTVVLHDVVLVSPDLAAGDFLEQVLPSLRRRAQRVTVYASSADFALWSSWGSNLERRVGLGGRFATLAAGVETIEVPYRATDAIGHNPFASEPFRDDLHRLLVQRLPAERRALPSVSRDDGKPMWRLP